MSLVVRVCDVTTWIVTVESDGGAGDGGGDELVDEDLHVLAVRTAASRRLIQRANMATAAQKEDTAAIDASSHSCHVITRHVTPIAAC